MEDESSDGSSDELCSYYKSAAKRMYRTALKRSAEVKLATVPAITLDISDSECKEISQPEKAVKKKIERPKRKQSRRIAKGRGKRKKLVNDVLSGESSSTPECIFNLSSSDSDAVNDLHEVQHLSTSSKGTFKRFRKDIFENASQNSDLDTENESTRSQEIATISDSDVELLSPLKTGTEVVKNGNELMSIKISWKLQPIQKFSLRRHQKFKTLIEHFSNLEGVPLEQIVIYGGKDSCRLIEPYDTPDTVGITVTDILEGGVLTGGSIKQPCLKKRFRDPSQADGDEIEVRVQQEKTRSFPVLIKCHQKMQVLFIKVAEQLEVDLDKVKLFLDGETISPNLTPNDLGLEDGDVLDMI